MQQSPSCANEKKPGSALALENGPKAQIKTGHWTAGQKLVLLLALALLLILVVASIMVGAGRFSLIDLLLGRGTARDWQLLMVSRIPRTAAIVLSGASMATAGLVMQMLVQNRFVEPSTTGVTESAGLGILLITIFWPGAPIFLKMCFAVLFALVGTFLLIALIRAIPKRDLIIVPLLGMVLAGVIGAASTFLAWEFQLQGTLAAWTLGDFSGILRGRYELLYIVAAAAVVTYFFADRFTVAGLGEELSRNLGLDRNRITWIGLVIVAVVAGITTVVAGSLPFLGLVVPNLVSLFLGDYMRRALPFVAIGGAVFVLMADLVSRLAIAPAELPVGVVMGVTGAAVFLIVIWRALKR